MGQEFSIWSLEAAVRVGAGTGRKPILCTLHGLSHLLEADLLVGIAEAVTLGQDCIKSQLSRSVTGLVPLLSSLKLLMWKFRIQSCRFIIFKDVLYVQVLSSLMIGPSKIL